MMLTKEILESSIFEYRANGYIKVKEDCEGRLVMEVTYETPTCSLFFAIAAILADAECKTRADVDSGTVDFSEKGIIRITLPA